MEEKGETQNQNSKLPDELQSPPSIKETNCIDNKENNNYSHLKRFSSPHNNNSSTKEEDLQIKDLSNHHHSPRSKKNNFYEYSNDDQRNHHNSLSQNPKNTSDKDNMLSTNSHNRSASTNVSDIDIISDVPGEIIPKNKLLKMIREEHNNKIRKTKKIIRDADYRQYYSSKKSKSRSHSYVNSNGNVESNKHNSNNDDFNQSPSNFKERSIPSGTINYNENNTENCKSPKSNHLFSSHTSKFSNDTLSPTQQKQNSLENNASYNIYSVHSGSSQLSSGHHSHHSHHSSKRKRKRPQLVLSPVHCNSFLFSSGVSFNAVQTRSINNNANMSASDDNQNGFQFTPPSKLKSNGLKGKKGIKNKPKTEIQFNSNLVTKSSSIDFDTVNAAPEELPSSSSFITEPAITGGSSLFALERGIQFPIRDYTLSDASMNLVTESLQFSQAEDFDTLQNSELVNAFSKDNSSLNKKDSISSNISNSKPQNSHHSSQKSNSIIDHNNSIISNSKLSNHSSKNSNPIIERNISINNLNSNSITSELIDEFKSYTYETATIEESDSKSWTYITVYDYEYEEEDSTPSSKNNNKNKPNKNENFEIDQNNSQQSYSDRSETFKNKDRSTNDKQQSQSNISSKSDKKEKESQKSSRTNDKSRCSKLSSLSDTPENEPNKQLNDKFSSNKESSLHSKKQSSQKASSKKSASEIDESVVKEREAGVFLPPSPRLQEIKQEIEKEIQKSRTSPRHNLSSETLSSDLLDNVAQPSPKKFLKSNNSEKKESDFHFEGENSSHDHSSKSKNKNRSNESYHSSKHSLYSSHSSFSQFSKSFDEEPNSIRNISTIPQDEFKRIIPNPSKYEIISLSEKSLSIASSEDESNLYSPPSPNANKVVHTINSFSFNDEFIEKEEIKKKSDLSPRRIDFNDYSSSEKQKKKHNYAHKSPQIERNNNQIPNQPIFPALNLPSNSSSTNDFSSQSFSSLNRKIFNDGEINERDILLSDLSIFNSPSMAPFNTLRVTIVEVQMPNEISDIDAQLFVASDPKNVAETELSENLTKRHVFKETFNIALDDLKELENSMNSDYSYESNQTSSSIKRIDKFLNEGIIADLNVLVRQKKQIISRTIIPISTRTFRLGKKVDRWYQLVPNGKIRIIARAVDEPYQSYASAETKSENENIKVNQNLNKTKNKDMTNNDDQGDIDIYVEYDATVKKANNNSPNKKISNKQKEEIENDLDDGYNDYSTNSNEI